MIKVKFISDFKYGNLEGMGIQIIVNNTDGKVLEADFERELDIHLTAIKKQVLYHRTLAMEDYLPYSQTESRHPAE